MLLFVNGFRVVEFSSLRVFEFASFRFSFFSFEFSRCRVVEISIFEFPSCCFGGFRVVEFLYVIVIINILLVSPFLLFSCYYYDSSSSALSIRKPGQSNLNLNLAGLLLPHHDRRLLRGSSRFSLIRHLLRRFFKFKLRL